MTEVDYSNITDILPSSIFPMLDCAYENFAISICDDLKVIVSDRAIEFYNRLLYKFKDDAIVRAYLYSREFHNLLVLPSNFEISTIVHELCHYDLRCLSLQILTDGYVTNLADIEKILNIYHIPDFIFYDDGILDAYDMKRYNYD
jgi:hypothetical protein